VAPAIPELSPSLAHDAGRRRFGQVGSSGLERFPAELLRAAPGAGEGYDIPTSFPELPELTVADYSQVALPNGLTVFLMEDHEVPMIYGSLLLRGGAQADPPDQSGLASVVASVQRNGGTARLPGPDLDLALEELGASIEVSAGLKTISIGFSSLAEDAPQTLGLVSEVIRDPLLPQSELDKARASGLNAIAHRYDSASAVPRRKLQELLYGASSPLARQTSVESLSSITREDLLGFMSTWQRPDTAVIGIAGDFDSAEMRAVVEAAFQDWTPQDGSEPQDLPALEDGALEGEASTAAAGRVYLVDKPGEEEAAVMMAEPGVALEDPDTPALDILGEILNGFGGRLFDKVRSQDGLTYSVSGGWEAPPTYKGLFTAGGNTAKPAQLVAAVQAVLEELLNAPPSEEEIAQAKQSAANSFVFQFSSKQQQLGRILVYSVLGLPEDYLVQYQSKLEAVSASDLLAATRRHLHPKEQTVVVVGDAARLEEQLRGLPDRPLERLPLRPLGVDEKTKGIV